MDFLVSHTGLPGLETLITHFREFRSPPLASVPESSVLPQGVRLPGVCPFLPQAQAPHWPQGTVPQKGTGLQSCLSCRGSPEGPRLARLPPTPLGQLHLLACARSRDILGNGAEEQLSHCEMSGTRTAGEGSDLGAGDVVQITPHGRLPVLPPPTAALIPTPFPGPEVTSIRLLLSLKINDFVHVEWKAL